MLIYESDVIESPGNSVPLASNTVAGLARFTHQFVVALDGTVSISDDTLKMLYAQKLWVTNVDGSIIKTSDIIIQQQSNINKLMIGDLVYSTASYVLSYIADKQLGDDGVEELTLSPIATFCQGPQGEQGDSIVDVKFIESGTGHDNVKTYVSVISVSCDVGDSVTLSNNTIAAISSTDCIGILHSNSGEILLKQNATTFVGTTLQATLNDTTFTVSQIPVKKTYYHCVTLISTDDSTVKFMFNNDNQAEISTFAALEDILSKYCTDGDGECYINMHASNSSGVALVCEYHAPWFAFTTNGNQRTQIGESDVTSINDFVIEV
jgi:hypothetical protein